MSPQHSSPAWTIGGVAGGIGIGLSPWPGSVPPAAITAPSITAPSVRAPSPAWRAPSPMWEGSYEDAPRPLPVTRGLVAVGATPSAGPPRAAGPCGFPPQRAASEPRPVGVASCPLIRSASEQPRRDYRYTAERSHNQPPESYLADELVPQAMHCSPRTSDTGGGGYGGSSPSELMPPPPVPPERVAAVSGGGGPGCAGGWVGEEQVRCSPLRSGLSPHLNLPPGFSPQLGFPSGYLPDRQSTDPRSSPCWSGTFSEPSRGFVGSSPSRSAFTSSTSSHASGNSCTGSGAPHGAEFREASLCASAASSHARPSVSVSSFGSDLTHAGLPDRPAIDSHRSRPCPDRPATDPSQSSRLAAPDVYACHPANPTQTGKVSGRSGTRSQVSPRASPHFATLPPPRLTKEESLTDQDILSFLEVGHTGLGLAQYGSYLELGALADIPGERAPAESAMAEQTSLGSETAPRVTVAAAAATDAAAELVAASVTVPSDVAPSLVSQSPLENTPWAHNLS